MADIVAKLQVDSSQYDQKLKSAVSQMTKMEQEVRRTGASFAYADKEEMAFVQSLGNMSTQASSAKSKLREYTDAIMSLTSTYRQMTDEEKNSDYGKALAQSIDKITAKAAQLKDIMADTQAEISRQASDTAAFDSLAGGIGTAVAAFQTLQGAMNLFGVENKDALQAIAKLQAAMAITNGLTQIQTALQKQSAVMLGITTVQKKPAAAAEALDTTAKTGNIAVTKAATVAQAALNAVAKANPYVLLASAIIAVGTALYTYIKKSNEATEAEKARKAEAEKARKDEKERAESVGRSAAELMTTYKRLSIEWRNLSNEQQRNEWIKNNQSEFNKLGISINNAKDAENAFVKQTAAMVQAFQLRAEAAAYQTLANDTYAEFITKKEQLRGQMVSAGQEAIGVRSFKASEGLYTLGNDGKYYYTEKGAQKKNESIVGGSGLVDLKNKAEGYVQKQVDLLQRANALIPKSSYTPKPTGGGNSSSGTGGGTTIKPEEVLPEGSIAAIEKRISELQDKFSKATTQEAREAINADIVALEEQLKGMRIEPKVEIPEGSMAALKNQLSELQKAWDLAADDDSRADIGKQIDEVTEKIKKMNGEVAKVTTASDMWSEHTDKLKEVQDRLAEFQAMMANESLSQEQRDWAAGMAKSYKEQLDEMLGLTHEAAAEMEDTWKTSLDNISSGIGAISTIGNAFDNIKGSVEDLQEAFSGEMDAWDALMTVFNSGISIMQTVMGVMEAINTLKELSAALSEKRAIAEATEATATTTAASTEVAAESEKMAASSAATATNTAEAASGAGKAMSAIPIVGPILAVAAIAAVLAAIMSAKSKAKDAGKFAQGGVVGGNSYSGDRLMANVNSGELILNRSQQDSIASQLTGNNPMQNLQLSTEISGTNLRIVLNNDNRSKGGSRGYYANIH